MKLIKLHDPSLGAEIEIDADAIVSITPYGLGSMIQLANAPAPVTCQERPSEVTDIVNGQ